MANPSAKGTVQQINFPPWITKVPGYTTIPPIYSKRQLQQSFWITSSQALNLGRPCGHCNMSTIHNPIDIKTAVSSSMKINRMHVVRAPTEQQFKTATSARYNTPLKTSPSDKTSASVNPHMLPITTENTQTSAEVR